MADNKSSLVQIHQDVLDEVNQSLKVSVVSVGSSSSPDYRNRARNVHSTTNVTTGAWVQLLSTVGSVAIKEIEIFDSSGETLEIGLGASGSEVAESYIFPGGNGRIPLQIAAGTRVSVRAVSATANSGELIINFYG